MRADELRRRADEISWWHGGMDLGQGVITRGRVKPAQSLLPRLQLPEVAGRTVLDIGTWDGFMAFECERRGAARVVAVDSFVWDVSLAYLHGNSTGRAGFDLAHAALGSRVEAVNCDVDLLSPVRYGTFDVVLFLGVLYHMRHPLFSLERAAAMSHDLMIVESLIDVAENPYPVMRFYPSNEQSGDVTNWWGPNPACIAAMLYCRLRPC